MEIAIRFHDENTKTMNMARKHIEKQTTSKHIRAEHREQRAVSVEAIILRFAPTLERAH